MILVTGATGFVGRALCAELQSSGRPFVAAARTGTTHAWGSAVGVGPIDAMTDWAPHLAGVTSVIHCAARVHQMDDPPEAIDAYRTVNTHGTLRLAEAAAEAGVRRFVFVSTIKVHGDETTPDRVFGPDSPLVPTDGYGRSKAEAEEALWSLSERSGLEVTVVRPPLVYGPGAKGNIERLVRLVQRRVPLPFGSIKNRRSLVGLRNLSQLLLCCADHPRAAGQAFVAGDEEVVSTPDVLRTLASALGQRSLLVPVPTAVLGFGLRAIGASGTFRRLVSDLEVDSSKCTELLGWVPADSAAESVRSVLAGPTA
jgi:nucleoside-diphosphate-sugar epimerase